MKVTDNWSGGRETVRGMYAEGSADWKKIRPDAHEHGHHDGALYAHEHEGGREPHDHSYECRVPAHDDPDRELECSKVPADSAVPAGESE